MRKRESPDHHSSRARPKVKTRRPQQLTKKSTRQRKSLIVTLTDVGKVVSPQRDDDFSDLRKRLNGNRISSIEVRILAFHRIVRASADEVGMTLNNLLPVIGSAHRLLLEMLILLDLISRFT